MNEGDINHDLIVSQIDQIGKRLDAADKLEIERFNNSDRALQVALDASNRALGLDQQREFVRSVEYKEQQRDLAIKFDGLSTTVTKISTTVNSNSNSVTQGPVFVVGIISTLVGIVMGMVTGAIQLGSVQTHVSINTDNISKLLTDETARIVEHAGENVLRGNLDTRQQLLEERIKQLEANGYIKPPDVAALVERIAKLEIEVKNGQPNK